MEDSENDRALWNAAAATYAERVGGQKDSFYRRIRTFLWTSFGDVRGLDVLDVGCGHGWLAEEFRKAGARVTAIDGSAALLAEARERYPQIQFHQHDLAHGLPGDSHYDRIVAHMVLMDIPDPGPLLAAVAKALRPGGVFVFSILHPAFYSRPIATDPATGERYRKIPDYLTHEARWVTSFGGHRHYHRPLSWYAAALAANGLLISGLIEPPSLPQVDIPEGEWDDYQRWFSRIPTMLAMSCVSQATAQPSAATSTAADVAADGSALGSPGGFTR